MMKLFMSFVVLFSLILVSCSDTDKKNDSTIEKVDNSSEVDTIGRSKTIVFFGNSLTAGYGLDQSESFPTLIQRKLDSLNMNYKVVNAGLSGETTAGGNTRIDWILQQPLDIFILELGANDGLRGIPIDETRKNLQSIIDKVKNQYPDVVILLAGMQVPPNMGQAYSREFRNLFSELARKNNIDLIPFLLEGVGGESRLNQPDGIHPTAEGHKLLARTVWSVLEKRLLKTTD
ncbi:MAG TPA: arylesterase [Chitinophagaceae bacterium]